MRMANAICLWLLVQAMRCALAFARLSAGNSIPARIAIIAMTTSNSINVKARSFEPSNLTSYSSVFPLIAPAILGSERGRYAEEFLRATQRIRAGDGSLECQLARVSPVAVRPGRVRGSENFVIESAHRVETNLHVAAVEFARREVDRGIDDRTIEVFLRQRP